MSFQKSKYKNQMKLLSSTSMEEANQNSKRSLTTSQKWRYLEEFTQEEKILFQYKVAPYILIQGILFKVGADD